MYAENKIAPGREVFSFLRGYKQLPLEHATIVKNEIMKALGVKTRVSWYQRLYGNIEPKVSEAADIEMIFEKYGIKNIWGA